VNQAIRPSADGAVADFGPHKVSFAIDANTDDAIQIQLPQPSPLQSPMVLRSHVVGLCYWAASGPSVMIASLTNSTGQIVPPAAVSYPDALGQGYDIVYHYSQSSIEQDIVIKARLPEPESVLPAGTDESQVMLGVITEFVDPPEPTHSPVWVDLTQPEQALGVQGPGGLMAEDLLFGAMRILGQGRCFVGGAGGPAVPTATTWLGQPRQTPAQSWRGSDCYVVDSTPYVLVKAQLAALPAGQGTGHGMFKPAKDLKTMLAGVPHHWPPATLHSSLAPRPMSLAKAGARPGPGLVLDWTMVYNYLLNIDFGGVLNAKVGPAAVGQSTNDFWNPWYYPTNSLVTVTNLAWANSTTSGVGVTVQNAPGDWANGAADAMMNTYMYQYMYQSTGAITITVANLPGQGAWDFYLYGHGPTVDNSVFQLSCGAATWGTLSNAVSGWNTLPNWVQGDEYVVFPSVPVASGQSVVISVLPDDINYSLICGLQANAVVPLSFSNYMGVLWGPAVFQDGVPLEVARSSQSTFTNVEFYDGATLLGSGSASILSNEFVLNWQSAAAGTHPIRAVGYDSFGHTTSVTNNLTVSPGYNSVVGMPFGVSPGAGVVWNCCYCPALANPATAKQYMAWVAYPWGWLGYADNAGGGYSPFLQFGQEFGPTSVGDVVLAFTAPSTGTVLVSGACGVENGGGGSGTVFYRLLKNSGQLYPATNWLPVLCPYSATPIRGQVVPFAVTTSVAAGDNLYLQVNGGTGSGACWPWLEPTATLGPSLNGLCVLYTNGAYSAPSVLFTSPTNGAVYTDAGPILVAATASDTNPGGSIISVQLFDNGTFLTNFTTAPYSLNLSLANGTNTLLAAAYDSYGQQASSAVTLYLSSVPPSITVQPASQTVFQGSSAAFSVVAGGARPRSATNGAWPGATSLAPRRAATWSPTRRRRRRAPTPSPWSMPTAARAAPGPFLRLSLHRCPRRRRHVSPPGPTAAWL
jgi:hypothetical protein